MQHAPHTAWGVLGTAGGVRECQGVSGGPRTPPGTAQTAPEPLQSTLASTLSCCIARQSTPGHVHAAEDKREEKRAKEGEKSGYNIACSMPISDAGTRGDLTTLGLVIRNG